MKIKRIEIPDVLLLAPELFSDSRGWFYESYNRRAFTRATGLDPDFVQDNHSRSGRNVVRGLHYQLRQAQGKLVRVVAGEIWDVVVDLRRSSPTFGRWAGMTMSADTPCQLWVPAGFAHGFMVLSEHAEVVYKATDFYAPEHERTLLWNDPALAISWPAVDTPTGDPVMSDKDLRGLPIAQAETFE